MYTDGACEGNPGPGGWAWVEPDGPFASGAEKHSTNQRMEIAAALEAVRAHPGPLEIVSDSTYVVNCFRDRWWEGWIARGWKTKARKPVANQDLWEPLIEMVRSRDDVTFRWVKGHGEDVWNDVADRLAVAAAADQRGRSGDRPPTDLGPADRTGPAPSRDPRIPPGHLIAVVGHRPPELGGYEPNPVADGVRRRLTDILSAKRELQPDATLLTGLQLGAEQLAAEAAQAAGVPYVVVLAFPDLDARWPPRSQRVFRDLLGGAEEQILLERKVPESPQKLSAALTRRDAWLARHADEAIVVWDGEDARLRTTAKRFEDHVGDDVWVVDPRGL